MTVPDLRRDAPAPSRSESLSLRVRRHGWFLALLGLGAALRGLAMAGYRPALWFPDSYTYVVTAMRPSPDRVRPAGYSMFLRALEPSHSFGAVTFTQHLLGLAIGVMIYLTVLHRRGPRWAAVLAAAPTLLDAYQLQLEHLLVSDTLFAFLLTAATCLALRQDGARLWRAAGVGLLLAVATLTRTAGLPLVAAFTIFFLYGSRPPKRLLSTGVMLAAVAVPLVAYGGWFYATYHRAGLVGANGVFLYARAMSFADCAVMKPPADLAVLCDPRPPGKRPPSQNYVWAPDSPLVKLPGITFTRQADQLAGRFAALALRRQPVDYAASALTELGRAFAWGRPVYPDAETYAYYEFPAVAPPPPDRYPATVGAEVARQYERGAVGTTVAEPYAGWLRTYQRVVTLPGPLLLVVLLTPPVALLARRAGRDGWPLPWSVAVLLLVIPAMTAEFDYRYALPATPLACLAAALAMRKRTEPGDSVRRA